MELTLRTVRIRDVVLGDESRIEDGVLTVDQAGIRGRILEDDRIASVDLHVARPGEQDRIVHCLDAVEPRTKLEGPGTVFPGFRGDTRTVGEGTTVRLGGMSVLASARFPQPQSGLLTAREAIVDMSGPGAPFSPFSRTLNLVPVLRARPDVENHDFDDAVRRTTLAVADELAGLAADIEPDEERTFDSSDRNPELPNVAYFYQIQGQGPMADTYLYGRTVENLVPTLIHPNETVDGALVSGVYVYACVKNPTYSHQNNPIIWELQARHGEDLNFVGVILNRGHNYTQMEKERSSHWAAKLARFLGADGVILTTEGGGNSEIDTMLACQYMEQLGIRTTVLHYEQPGPDGRAYPLTFTVPEADAFVSLGSISGTADLPEMARIIGDEVLLGDDEVPARGPLEAPVLQLYSATNQVGGNVLVGTQF